MKRHQRIAPLFNDGFWGTHWRSQEKQLETEKSAEKRKGNEVKDKERETSEQKQEKEKALSV